MNGLDAEAEIEQERNQCVTGKFRVTAQDDVSGENPHRHGENAQTSHKTPASRLIRTQVLLAVVLGRFTSGTPSKKKVEPA